MPFSFLAVKCIHFAQQPLKYRMNFVKNVYFTKFYGNIALFTGVKIPIVYNTILPMIS